MAAITNWGITPNHCNMYTQKKIAYQELHLIFYYDEIYEDIGLVLWQAMKILN